MTVVDAAEFHDNLASMKTYEEGDTLGTIAELLTEQVEFSNVVVLNKQDLVTPEQKDEILDRIALLNPKAKVLVVPFIMHSLKWIIGIKMISNCDLFTICTTNY